jgi:hypothetical protein
MERRHAEEATLMRDWKRKKAAIYLRRSPGEKGSTADQLKRIMPMIKAAEKKRQIRKVNRGIVGKDIKGKRRFKASRDLALKGDIFNEGEGASGFNVKERPVLMELLKRIEAGDYDAAIAESNDRFARDPLVLAYFALPLWREGGKVFWGLNDGRGLSDNPEEEAVVVTSTLWGGIAKKGEAKKAKAALQTKWSQGFIMGSRPEWLGGASKQAGLDYRKAWETMLRFGEVESGRYAGNLRSPSDVAKVMKRTIWDEAKQIWTGDNKWASLWYRKMSGWNELGVLDAWLDGVEAFNRFIENQGEKPGWSYKREPATNIRNSTRGFFAYPAGVQPAGTDLFVTFPNPLDIGLQELAENSDPMMIDGWEVVVEPVGDRLLTPTQTQQGKA